MRASPFPRTRILNDIRTFDRFSVGPARVLPGHDGLDGERHDPRPSGRPDPGRDAGQSGELRNYVPEIMRAEGLNDFDAPTSVGAAVARSAGQHDVVVPRGTSFSDATRRRCSPTGSSPGGNLIAMHPRCEPRRAARARAPSSATPAAGGYLRVDTSTGARRRHHQRGDAVPRPRRPLRAQRRHRDRDLWSRHSPTGNPAVTLRDVGATAVRPRPSPTTFALGRPDAPGQPGVGGPGARQPTRGSIRSDDMFFGDAAARLARPPTRADPSADEQQRLLANLITEMARTPMPRFWYLPNGLKAAVVLTGDDHGRDARQRHGERLPADVAAKPSARLLGWPTGSACARRVRRTRTSGLDQAAAAGALSGAGLRDRAAPPGDQRGSSR